MLKFAETQRRGGIYGRSGFAACMWGLCSIAIFRRQADVEVYLCVPLDFIPNSVASAIVTYKQIMSHYVHKELRVCFIFLLATFLRPFSLEVCILSVHPTCSHHLSSKPHICGFKIYYFCSLRCRSNKKNLILRKNVVQLFSC